MQQLVAESVIDCQCRYVAVGYVAHLGGRAPSRQVVRCVRYRLKQCLLQPSCKLFSLARFHTFGSGLSLDVAGGNLLVVTKLQ